MKLVIVLTLIALVILCCVLLNNASSKAGVPVLLAFIILGMFVGNNHILPLTFNDYRLSGDVCTAALIFIMFYGGFGTNWKTARNVATQAGLLASAGVIVTAAVTGLFCHFALHWAWLESLLMGAVISSTDAASVFSILRSRKLGLKNHEAPLIEVESGSNDPLSYMLTIVMLSLIEGNADGAGIAVLLAKQIVLGAVFGFVIAKGALAFLQKVKFATSGFDSLFVLAVAIFSYAIPSLLDGNGYLSAYIVGIIMGNSQFSGKKNLVGFFDGITDLMMVIIFFILGLLSTPADIMHNAVPAVLIFLCITFISRPVAVVSILSWFRKYPANQLGFISLTGLRGAASIVFAIMITTSNAAVEHDIFSIVFGIVLISIAVQGSFIPLLAKKLGVVDPDANVMTTFNDFADNYDMEFTEVEITADSAWKGKKIMELGIPRNLLMCLLLRSDGSREIPNGDTVLEQGDVVIICTRECRNNQTVKIVEHPLSHNSKWEGRMVKEYPFPKMHQLMLIRRGENTIIPNGNTVLQRGDILYINEGLLVAKNQ